VEVRAGGRQLAVQPEGGSRYRKFGPPAASFTVQDERVEITFREPLVIAEGQSLEVTLEDL
jgi:hypothetical protein